MTINLISARRGLYNKCLELFANKNIAERIYRYLCDGIEDCEEAEAIPIEWIEKQKAECTPGSIPYIALEALLKTWREERNDPEAEP